MFAVPCYDKINQSIYSNRTISYSQIVLSLTVLLFMLYLLITCPEYMHYMQPPFDIAGVVLNMMI